MEQNSVSGTRFLVKSVDGGFFTGWFSPATFLSHTIGLSKHMPEINQFFLSRPEVMACEIIVSVNQFNSGRNG